MELTLSRLESLLMTACDDLRGSMEIRQEDTLREPQHLDTGNELRRFDRVVANPPFSQNYIKKDLKFPGRFPVMLPEKGKKADLMFVQHMLSVLRHDGRLASVMPHGVLFRGGEEREARKHFIDRGEWLGRGADSRRGNRPKSIS